MKENPKEGPHNDDKGRGEEEDSARANHGLEQGLKQARWRGLETGLVIRSLIGGVVAESGRLIVEKIIDEVAK